MPAVSIPTDRTAARQPGQPWTLDEFAEFMTVCRKTVERAARLKSLKTIKVGARTLIPDSEVRRVAECGLTTAN